MSKVLLVDLVNELPTFKIIHSFVKTVANEPPKPMPNRWINGDKLHSFDLLVDEDHNIKQFFDKTARCPTPGDCEEC